MPAIILNFIINQSLFVFSNRCLLIVLSLMIGGCSHFSQPPEQTKVPLNIPLRPPIENDIVYTQTETPLLHSTQKPQTRFKPTPSPPQAENLESAQLRKLEVIPSFKTTAPIRVNIEGLPVSAFINEVFGNLLGLSFEISPEVQNKKELVTLRVTEAQTPEQLYKLARQVVVNYGVDMQKQGDLVRFVMIDPNSAPSPSLILTTGETLPEVPPSHRSVIQFITLKVVGTGRVKNWVEQAFTGHPLRVVEDVENNAVILVGPPPLIKQATEVVKLLDQTSMRGQYSVRIEPAFIGAQQLTDRLSQVLNSEGYFASGTPRIGSIILLPFNETNSLIAFASDPKVLAHVQEWAQQLDQVYVQPSTKPNLFFYPVKNTAAQSLANVVNGLQQSATQLTVDPLRNALLFLGTNEEWVRLLPILQDMDKPAKQVLIEATLAEITLTDKQEHGIEWVLKHANLGGLDGQLGTLGTLGVGSAGLTYMLSNAAEVRAVLNAFVSSSRATILSTPRLLVRSGSQANINVGNEIPILSSQSTTNQVQGGNTAILQQIQYRRTGVNLSIQPVVYAGRRIDITISQEVSSSQPNTTSNISSPIILNRQLSTQLTLKDGQSVLLGGLISNTRTEGYSGVPILKDLPVVGQLFRVNKNSEDRTELVVMLVPYVLDGDEEAKKITEAIRRRLELLPTAVIAPP